MKKIGKYALSLSLAIAVSVALIPAGGRSGSDQENTAQAKVLRAPETSDHAVTGYGYGREQHRNVSTRKLSIQ